MKKVALALLCLGLVAAAVLTAGESQARRPCPPGYYWEGPYGCMPYGPPPPPPPPPPPYYDPYYPRPCPPGTYWGHGACRPVPPPPHYGITIDVPPIIIR
ncbi:hypothetical protein [Desulfolutivibrio sulfoxidireducens]|uniref:hypothetical protein n=1 Tax=Desulfolutivibrio sulfoxidireducens TaxID=2773299 RepID=UPI00159DB441|nr:hypothetical protein [Desulfolutivibrio sulfoxidireducens]QLA17395.1 hypothetical protein GD605_15535 [Desulfolutivibrio sulfoxidireducens]QLA20992.1 hypothetical protein GD604_15325 [Desulfolutivibrio sulfoxidireducens]